MPDHCPPESRVRTPGLHPPARCRPRPREVLIEVAAAGVNQLTFQLTRDFYPPPPRAPCRHGGLGIILLAWAPGARLGVGDRACAPPSVGGYVSSPSPRPVSSCPCRTSTWWKPRVCPRRSRQSGRTYPHRGPGRGDASRARRVELGLHDRHPQLAPGVRLPRRRDQWDLRRSLPREQLRRDPDRPTAGRISRDELFAATDDRARRRDPSDSGSAALISTATLRRSHEGSTGQILQFSVDRDS
jgi:hypothetical protein